MKFNVSRRLVAVFAVLVLAIVPSMAAASEHEQDAPEVEESRFGAVVDAAYDEMLQVLIFAINVAGAEPVDCSVPDGVVLSRDSDGDAGDVTVTVDEGEWDIPTGCTIVDVRGPNGQVNHGQVVSSFVHALKALDRSMIDVPFGQLVRQIAGSDLGKSDKHADTVDDDAEDSVDVDGDDDGNGPPPHANNDKDKDKKSKSNGSNNGNGRGPNK